MIKILHLSYYNQLNKSLLLICFVVLSYLVCFFSIDVLLEQLLHRVPVLNEVQASKLRTGYEAYTPDGRAILGIVPEVSMGTVQC